MMIKFALFTTAALVQGQEVGDSGRRPLNVDNFESQEALDFFESLEDFDSSTPDYMADYNSALDNYDGTDYSYDGTALNCKLNIFELSFKLKFSRKTKRCFKQLF